VKGSSQSVLPGIKKKNRMPTLLDELKSWRARTARAACLQPSEICSDQDLAKIAEKSSISADDLAGVFGEISSEKFGSEIIKTIEGHFSRSVEASKF
jgi:ribonuclease D